MKKWLSLSILISGLVLLNSPFVHAITLGFTPSSSVVAVGDSLTVDVVIDGLGDLAAPSLGAYDFDVLFDTSILDLTGVTFGTQLDLFSLGSLQDVTMMPSGVNIAELSFDSSADLDTLQAVSFTLASLSFNAVGVGISPLDIGSLDLRDSLGILLTASVDPGSVVVSTPEPASLLLMASGLLGLGLWSKGKKVIS